VIVALNRPEKRNAIHAKVRFGGVNQNESAIVSWANHSLHSFIYIIINMHNSTPTSE
jgi:hypothetical protein